MDGLDVAFTKLQRDRDDRFQSLRRELGAGALGINLIVLQAGQRGRVHNHEHQEEIFLVLEGELTLIVEREDHRLGVDELARVGPAVRRQLVNTGPDRLVLLALGAHGEHVGRDALAWAGWDDDGPGRPPRGVPLPDDLPLMADWDDVRRLALALPDTAERSTRGHTQWRVHDKLFVWERPLRPSDIAALGPQAPTGPILGARVEHLVAKETLLADATGAFFTIPHFDGYPAVLVLLERIDRADLEEVVVEAWLARAPKRLARAYLAQPPH